MTMLALRLLLSGWASKIWAWLCHRSFWQLMFGAALILVGWEYLGKRSEQRHAHKVESQLSKCTAGRKADLDTYRKGQTDAAAKNLAHVADIEAQQKRISDARLKDANDRLARLSGELRAHGPAAQGYSNGAGPSAPAHPADGTHGSSGLCLSPEQLLRAAQDEERHDQLITWLEQQLTIDPNK